MLTVLSILALLMPIILPASALALANPFGRWWRSAAVFVVALASLPVGAFLLVFCEVPDFLKLDHVNPAIGIVAVPVVNVWLISFPVAIVWIIAVGLQRRPAP
jgi:hypothetical protein